MPPQVPIDQKILRQEHGDDHAHLVMHPPRGRELSHARIDQGEACAALFPGQEPFRILAPGEVRKGGTKGLAL